MLGTIQREPRILEPSFANPLGQTLLHAGLGLVDTLARHIRDHQHLAALDRRIELLEASVADVHADHASEPRTDAGACERVGEQYAARHGGIDEPQSEACEAHDDAGCAAQQDAALHRGHEITFLQQVCLRQPVERRSAPGENVDAARFDPCKQQLIYRAPCHRNIIDQQVDSFH
jgi:hypothetical protein